MATAQESIVDSIVAASGIERTLVAKALVRPQELGHGDFAFPCFALAKEWKVPPPQAAKRIADALKLPAEVERVELVGPYLNFFLARGAIAKTVIEGALKAGNKIGAKAPNGRKVIVEYSSVNTAKTLHVGHLRSTLIGLSLDRLYRHLGYDVTSINHIGDWGTQFGFVWAGCELWGLSAVPTVEELQARYVQASALKKAQEDGSVPEVDKDKPDVQQMARSYFLRLEENEPQAFKFWKMCCDVSLAAFKKAYKRLDIHFDHYTGESFYRDKLEDTENQVKNSGILQESQGALGVDLGKELGFARIFAEDGRSLYMTRDLATAIYRANTFNPEKILYVVGAQQTLYFRQLIEIFKRMKHPVAERMVHVPFGFVPGMKTRSGSAISVDDFLDEAHERALKAYREEVEKRPEGVNEAAVAEKVALGAVYFYYLSHSNIKDFRFTWEQALSFQGDTGPYVQYALARLNSIAAKAGEAGINYSGGFNAELLKDDAAYELVSAVSRFGEVLQKTADEYEPYYITQYVLEVAKSFAGVYKTLRVIGEAPETAKARLALFDALKHVLHCGLYLIGVPPVEQM